MKSLTPFFAVLVLAMALVSCGQDVTDSTNGNGAVPSAPATVTSAPQATATMTVAPSATVQATAIMAETVTPTAEGSSTTAQATATTRAVETAEYIDGMPFDGEQAFEQLEAQMAIGPRWPGSEGHKAVGDYIVASLETLGWEVEEQLFDYQGVQGRNIIGRANVGQGPVVIVGAHYDTRRLADQTPGAVDEQLPVPGAVDGASGVAVLLELARTLDLPETPREIWLAFFDMEDNGGGAIEGWDWIVGSTYMAENLDVMPEAMVLVDMIGDADQQLYYEGNSDAALREVLWEIAADLGYGDAFIPQLRYTMIDDHVPFARRGIAAVDIIDFDYPYWHTVEDTADKASADSLERVGRTVEVWLEQDLE